MSMMAGHPEIFQTAWNVCLTGLFAQYTRLEGSEDEYLARDMSVHMIESRNTLARCLLVHYLVLKSTLTTVSLYPSKSRESNLKLRCSVEQLLC